MGKSKGKSKGKARPKWKRLPSQLVRFQYGEPVSQKFAPANPLTLEGVTVVCRERRNFKCDVSQATQFFARIGIDISEREVAYIWDTWDGVDEHTKLRNHGWMGHMYAYIMNEMRDDPK